MRGRQRETDTHTLPTTVYLFWLLSALPASLGGSDCPRIQTPKRERNRPSRGPRGPWRGAGLRPLPCCSPACRRARARWGGSWKPAPVSPGNPPASLRSNFETEAARSRRRNMRREQEPGSLTVADRSRSAPFPGLSSGLVRPLHATRLE